jgi:hypothetical protein
MPTHILLLDDLKTHMEFDSERHYHIGMFRVQAPKLLDDEK